jgi:hypothetical protein
MARGLVIGQVFKAAGHGPEANADVSIAAIRGADVNGSLVTHTVPMKSRGGYSTALRPTNDAGVFIIPFRWDETSSDNWGRVTGADTLKIKVTVISADGNRIGRSDVDGFKVMDGLQLPNDIKNGLVLRQGAGRSAIANLTPDKIKPAFKKAITGKEFDGLPFTLFTTDQTAILGLLPGMWL